MALTPGTKFEAGQRFVAFREGVKYVGEFKAGAEGKLFVHAMAPKGWKAPTEEVGGKPIQNRIKGGKDGRTFVSLDAFGMATTYPKVSPSINVYFTPEADWVQPVAKPVKEVKAKAEKAPKAEKAATGKAKGKTKTVARKTKDKAGNTKVGGFTIYPNGKYMCDACLQSYPLEEGGTLPEACPAGHTHGKLNGEDEGEDIEELDLSDDAADELDAVAEAEAILSEA